MKEKIKISLISPCSSLVANGLRIISAYLKENGYQVKLIFLNDQSPFSSTYTKEVFEDLCFLCKDSDLIGISVMTNYFIKISDLTLRLKERLGIPIIWGGIHPTVKPEECLGCADMICIGEGEEAMLELAEKLKLEDSRKIRNIWINNNKIIKNEVRALEENLDKYPFPDYDINTQYILKDNRIVKMTDMILETAMQKNNELGRQNCEYYLITTRNCPHNCSYCCNSAIRKIYDGKGKFVRKRSIQNILKELELIKERFHFVKQVLITDDTFFIRDKLEIGEFCNYYKERIGLPIRCYISPFEMDEEKIKLMVDAGLFRVSVGIQSYNYQTLISLYKRPTPKSVITKCISIVNKYKSKIPRPVYHIIIDNPYETNESKKESIKFVASLPPGTRVLLFPLVLFPGTDLYKRAKDDGLIKDEKNDVYLKGWKPNDVRRMDYLTCLLYACAGDRHQRVKEVVKVFINLLLNDKIIFLFGNKFSLAMLKKSAILIRHVIG